MAEGPSIHPSTSSSDQSSSQDSPNEEFQVPTFGGLKSPNGNIPAFPIMYPALVPGLFPPRQDQEQLNRGPGLYAVPVLPYMQHIAGFPPNTLIPFTYNIPTERSSQESREVAGDQGQPGERPQQQQPGPQRQVVVRRFQIAIQLDLLLILKLAAVIFLFNQDGSRQRLTLLVFFASLVYLYQTGALAPVIRWLSQGMRRAAAPPQPPRPAVRADNLPAAGGQGNENVGVAEGQVVGENENQQVDGNRAIENDHAGEPGQGVVGNRWWGIVKEIQMIVFGFITSLLPGFQNID
ncbi:hypothetical protein CDL12_10295 [Handroanthus impetiginosus]|uniref:Transmembrane protein n=1 Tax=Handroanthus impetiginosus TaxID=429701 RepID=A0A2G9HHK5_9LAMI|nr:hypothetical protein CDL12_10295 [Handroanthus impetiginosus]